MNPVQKSSLMALAEAMNPKTEQVETEAETVADFVKKLLAEPDRKRRKQMIKDFSARRADVADFIRDNEDLINAEAEMALIGAAVGVTVVEKEISYKNGRKQVSQKEKKTAPNVGALNMYLKNRMPDKYSDKPQTEPEYEDVSEMEENIYGDGKKT